MDGILNLVRVLKQKQINAKSHLEARLFESAKDFKFLHTSSEILTFWWLETFFHQKTIRRVQKVAGAIRGQGGSQN